MVALLLQVPTSGDLAELAAQLSDDDVEVREASEAALEAAGERAIPLLLSAAESGSPESHFRALRLLSRLETAPQAVDLQVDLHLEGGDGDDLLRAIVTLVNRGRRPILVGRDRFTLRGLVSTRRPEKGFELLPPGGRSLLLFEGLRMDLHQIRVLCRGLRPPEFDGGSTMILRPLGVDAETLADLLNTMFSPRAARFSAVADVRTRLLVLQGSPADLRQAREVVADVDVNGFPGEDAHYTLTPYRGDLEAALEALLYPESCSNLD